jgi:transposase
VPKFGCQTSNMEPSVTHYKRIAIDTSKHVFTLHGVDEQDNVILQRNLPRSRLQPFFAALPPTTVVLEACGASHHWGRTLQAAGHTVRLIPPQYVKPFVKRAKNDRNDAEAISEAASRPTMRFVPVKPAETQAQSTMLSVRELLVRQQTQLVNAMRGHASEFGVVTPQGPGGRATLRQAAAQAEMPQAARHMIEFLDNQINRLAAEIATLDAKLKALHKSNPVSHLLAEIPGIGPIGAITLALRVDPAQFKSGRHFAAWIGLTPKERSTGGKQRLGAISRAGDERLRQLLVLGATAVIRHARPGQAQTRTTKPRKPSAAASPWLLSLLERRPRKVAAVALANKMARIAWAMMTSGEEYRRNTLAA